MKPPMHADARRLIAKVAGYPDYGGRSVIVQKDFAYSRCPTIEAFDFIRSYLRSSAVAYRIFGHGWA